MVMEEGLEDGPLEPKTGLIPSVTFCGKLWNCVAVRRKDNKAQLATWKI